MATVEDSAVVERRTRWPIAWLSGRRPPRPAPFRDVRATIALVLPPLLFALVVLALWQIFAGVTGIKESSLPKPTQIATAVWNDRSLLLSNGWVTVKEILLGYLAAVIVGVGLAMIVSTSRIAERALYPWLVVSQTIPVVALAPIFVIWFGFDIRPKLIVIAIVTFFPITVNTIDGLKSTDPELLNLLRTLGASRWRQFRVARFPASLPFVFSGLKVAAVFSVIGAVFGEWVGSSNGLGYLILTYNNQTATADTFASICALSLIGIMLFFLVAALERLALPWYHETRRGEHVAGERP